MDTDCGVRRIFYRPVNDPEDLHHGEPSVVRAWVARDNIAQLHPTGTQLFWGKVNGLLGLPTLEIPIAVEATVVCLVSKIQASIIPADVSRWPVTHLPIQALRRILKATQSMFKHGVYVHATIGMQKSLQREFTGKRGDD